MEEERANKSRVVSPYFAKKSQGDTDSSLVRSRVVSPYFDDRTKKKRKRKNKRNRADPILEVTNEILSCRLISEDDDGIRDLGCVDESGENIGRFDEEEIPIGEKECVYFDRVTGCWGCKNFRRWTEYRLGKQNLVLDYGNAGDDVDDYDCHGTVGNEVTEKRQKPNSSVSVGMNLLKNLDDLLSRFAYKGGTEMKRIVNACDVNKLRVEEAEPGIQTRTDVVSQCFEFGKPEDRNDVSSVSSQRRRKSRKGSSEAQAEVRVVSRYFHASTSVEQPKALGNVRRCSKVMKVSKYFHHVNTDESPSNEKVLKQSPRMRKTPLVSPALSRAQKVDEAYLRKTPDNTWVPPRSHYNLLQEDHWHDPWRVMVICMLLNRTSGAQVSPYSLSSPVVNGYSENMILEMFKKCLLVSLVGYQIS